MGSKSVWLAPCVLCAIGIAAACGSDGGGPGFATDSGVAAEASDDSGSSDDIDLVGDGNSDANACPTSCSSDLHDVVDCNGVVLTTCPPDQGCSPGGGCVAACDSATQNKSTYGCDYYDVDPDVIQGDYGDCFAAYVANTWTSPVKITVDYAGQKLDVTKFGYTPKGTGTSITYTPLGSGGLPPQEVAILFLSNAPGVHVACPAGTTPAVTSDAAVHGTGVGNAFHVATSVPVVMYDIFPYGGGSAAVTSATLLLPTSAWDTNYVAVDAYYRDQIVSFALPFITIVGQQDHTKVTISPTAAIVGGGGLAPTGQGKPHDYYVDRGQTIQFEQDAELIGSPIQSDKPIGVWGGASCLNVEVDQFFCDEAHQQIAPVKALGHEYVGVRYRNRLDNGPDETPPWRLVGAVDGTTLQWEPQPPPGAPTKLSSGEVQKFSTAGPFVVRSQDDKHPFYLAAHMTGSGTVGSGYGDPEWVNVVPGQQYLASYVFFTDPTYPETDLVLVRTKGGGGFADVTLDCVGTVGGWKPLGNAGAYEYARVDLVRHDFAPQGKCDNGRHEAKSTLPFGLTVWGWGTPETQTFTQNVSYAYPAGESVLPINQVVVPPNPK